MNISKKNIIINYVSFIIAGSSGILINILILKTYGINVLGTYNFIFTFLLILSQFCVGGIQFSILKHNSYFVKKLREISKSLISALFLSFFFNFLVISILYLTLPFFELIFKIDNFSLSMYLIFPALLFFSFNKILLMSLNGMNLMHQYAFFNLLRYLFLLTSIICFYLFEINEKYIVVVFSISEILLFIVLFLFTFLKILKIENIKKYWVKRHFYFGIKGMLGGALMESNARIDILMIGSLLGNNAVGIYSFASMIAEGFSQILFILKNNVDPVFGSAYNKKDYKKINLIIKEIRQKYVPYVVLFGILIIILYKFIFVSIFDMEQYIINESWYILLILIFFMCASSLYRPFIGILNQINMPAKFSQIIMLSVFFNFIFNILLIPTFGIYGAAFSTGVIFLIESYLILLFGLKKLNERLIYE